METTQPNEVDVQLEAEPEVHVAARVGDVAQVQRLVGQPAIDVNVLFKNETPLQVATKHGRVDVVRVLCACSQTQVNALSKENAPALYIALTHRQPPQWRSGNPSDDGDELRLKRLWAANTLAIALLLLDHKDIRVDFDFAAEGGALMVACQQGIPPVVDALLKRPDVDVNLQVKRATPLIVACRNGSNEIAAKLLADERIDANVAPIGSIPALWAALLKLKSREDMDQAEETRVLALVNMLLDHPDTDVNVPHDFATPLAFAIQFHLDDVAHKLIRMAKTRVNATTVETTPLLVAAEVGSADTVKLLCGRRDLVLNSAQNERAALAFYIAVKRASRDVQQARESAASEWAAHDPVDEASIPSVAVVEALCGRADLDVNFAPQANSHCVDPDDSSCCYGDTPLTLACQFGLERVVHWMCQHPSLQVNARGKFDETALMSTFDDKATRHPAAYANISRMLLTMPGIDVNAQRTDGHTALHLAASHDNDDPDIVDFLLHQPHIQHDLLNNEGKTPLDCALEKQASACVQVFVEKGLAPRIHCHPYFSMDRIASHLTVDASVNLLLGDLPFQIQNGAVAARHDHDHTWSKFLDVRTPVDKSVRVETVQQLLSHPILNHPSLARELALSSDMEGRAVLQITDAATRDLLNGYLFFCGRYDIVDGPPIHVSATAVVVHAFDHGIFQQVFDMHATRQGLDKRGFVQCGRILSPSQEHHETAFEAAARGGTHMAEHDYLRYCNQTFGATALRVAIKFMRHQQDYARELGARTDLDADFVVGILSMPDKREFDDGVGSLTIHGNLHMREFPHVLVMPAADRSLEDIFLKERPTDTKIRAMMRDVAEAVDHLHAHGMVHGDLKKLNVLRVNNTLRLIDLDAATRVGDAIGSKFSSGILPPEMFAQLKTPEEVAAFEAYWKAESRVEWWPKVQPRHGWVVRSFREHAENVPYALLKASPALDMWAFGCILFQMYSECELVPTDRNQDVDDDAAVRAAMWSPDALAQRVRSKVSNALAADLIQKLLVVEPENRMGIRQVLGHAYFNVEDCTSAAIGAKLDRLQVQVARGFEVIGHKLDTVVEVTRESLDRLARTKEDLMRGIFQATEVSVPTSFVILPFNLADQHDDAEGVLIHTASFVENVVEMGRKFMRAAKANKAIGSAVKLVAPGDPLYLYLLDEVHGTPVTSSAIYPIRIDTKSDEYVRFMTVAMPYIQTGFKCLNWANTAAGWLKVLGVPSLDADVMADVAGKIDAATKKSSVFDFDVLQAAVEAVDAGAPIQHIRGAALRQLEQFFRTFDANGDYAGLERTYASNGQVLWTTKDTIAQMEKHRIDRLPPKKERVKTDRAKGLTAQGIYLSVLKKSTGEVQDSAQAQSDENVVLSDDDLPQEGCACRVM